MILIDLLLYTGEQGESIIVDLSGEYSVQVTSYDDFVATYHMYIFNRWGQMMFESSDLQQGWDGTYKGKPVAGGIYVYRIDYSVSGSQSQKSETLMGNVVLVR